MTADDVALAARVVVAIILVVSGLGKLLALGPTFRASRSQFGSYAWITLLVALALPVYELVLAVLLLVVDASWPSWLASAHLRRVHGRARAPDRAQRPSTVQLLRCGVGEA